MPEQHCAELNVRRNRSRSTTRTGLLKLASAAALTVATWPAHAVLAYNWQARPNIGDSYISTDMPQPVCVIDNGVPKILIFTNYDYYHSQNLYNASNAVRVGQITTPIDTYTLKPGSLPGKRYAFSVASFTPSNSNSTVYLFGGRNNTGDLGDIYAYDPATASFSAVTNTAGATLTLPTPRSGVTAVSSGNRIWLFGGHSGSQVLNDVLIFDPVAKTITTAPPMSFGFYGARAMVKAVGTANHVYFVGAKLVDGGGPSYEIYRYRTVPSGGQLLTVKDSQSGNAPMQSSAGPATPMVTWDPSGTIRVISAAVGGASGLWTWDRFEAGPLYDTYSNNSSNASATLGSAPYITSARARDMAGAVKCSSSTYIVGGTYGHGVSLQDRSYLLDRLNEPGRLVPPPTIPGLNVGSAAKKK